MELLDDETDDEWMIEQEEDDKVLAGENDQTTSVTLPPQTMGRVNSGPPQSPDRVVSAVGGSRGVARGGVRSPRTLSTADTGMFVANPTFVGGAKTQAQARAHTGTANARDEEAPAGGIDGDEDVFGDDDPLITCDKKTMLGVFGFCLLIALVVLVGQSKPIKNLFFGFLQKVEKASWGAPLMMLCLLVMVPAMIPTTPFNVAAGYLFGWAGLPVLMVGAIGGAQLAFLLCRACLASWARKKLANLKLFKLIDNLSADDDSKLSWRSFKIVLLTRGSPIFPFPLINYAHGVTRVSPMSYFLGTGLGMLPWLTLDVYFGGLLKSLEDVENGHSKGYLITVGIASLVTTVYITYYSKQTLKNMRKNPVTRARARWTAEDGLEEVLLGEDSVGLIENEEEFDDGDY